jgi:SNF2 family DNA or RNA helicase
MSRRSTLPPLEYAISPVAWTPHAYQKRAVQFLLKHGGAALFLDPGLGKTSIVWKALAALRKARHPGVTLVIAPLRVCYQVWPKEREKWTDFADMTCDVLHGRKKEDVFWNTEADVLCVNPEALEWLFGVTKVRSRGGKRVKVILDRKRVKHLFDTLGVTNLVVDESTKFKKSKSIRFKIIREVLHQFERRWILTGTPAPNGLIDLFSQIFIVDEGRALGRFVTHYRKMYFHEEGYGGHTLILKNGAQQQIEKRIKPYVLRLDAEDYIKMPDIVINPISVELPDAARKLYDQMEEELAIKIGRGDFVALNTAAAQIKCAQIANGGIYKTLDPLVSNKRATGKDAWKLLHNAKDEAVLDLYEELGGKQLLIGYEFQHDLERLKKVFGKELHVLGGTPREAAATEAAWNAGRINVLAAHPASAGHGLNLQGSDAHHIAWYGFNHDFELFDQFCRRLRRQGNKAATVFAHMLVARNTVDVAKLYALRSKNKTQKGFLDAMRVYVRERQATAPRVRGRTGLLAKTPANTGARARLRGG